MADHGQIECQAQRVDKWLWHARFTRTRSLAQKLVMSGKLRIDGIKYKTPSRAVRIGDVLTLTLARDVVVIRIAGFAERRVSFDQARKLYEQIQPGASAQQN